MEMTAEERTICLKNEKPFRGEDEPLIYPAVREELTYQLLACYADVRWEI